MGKEQRNERGGHGTISDMKKKGGRKQNNKAVRDRRRKTINVY